METITVSSKGQLVIPKAMRLSARIEAGTVLEASFVGGEIRLRPQVNPAASTLDQVAGCLARPGRKALDETQEKALIKARLKARNRAA